MKPALGDLISIDRVEGVFIVLDVFGLTYTAWPAFVTSVTRFNIDPFDLRVFQGWCYDISVLSRFDDAER